MVQGQLCGKTEHLCGLYLIIKNEFVYLGIDPYMWFYA